jgi:hypothetical protein
LTVSSIAGVCLSKVYRTQVLTLGIRDWDGAIWYGWRIKQVRVASDEPPVPGAYGIMTFTDANPMYSDASLNSSQARCWNVRNDVAQRDVAAAAATRDSRPTSTLRRDRHGVTKVARRRAGETRTTDRVGLTSLSMWPWRAMFPRTSTVRRPGPAQVNECGRDSGPRLSLPSLPQSHGRATSHI